MKNFIFTQCFLFPREMITRPRHGGRSLCEFLEACVIMPIPITHQVVTIHCLDFCSKLLLRQPRAHSRCTRFILFLTLAVLDSFRHFVCRFWWSLIHDRAHNFPSRQNMKIYFATLFHTAPLQSLRRIPRLLQPLIHAQRLVFSFQCPESCNSHICRSKYGR